MTDLANVPRETSSPSSVELCSTCHDADRRPGQRTCRSCHAAWMRKNRPKYRDLGPEAKRKENARARTKMAVRRGHLTRQPCEVCGAADTEAHHDDYSRPLDVRWLCRPHHLAHHKEHPE